MAELMTFETARDNKITGRVVREPSDGAPLDAWAPRMLLTAAEGLDLPFTAIFGQAAGERWVEVRQK